MLSNWSRRRLTSAGVEHLARLQRRHQEVFVAGEAAQVIGQAVGRRLWKHEAVHRADARQGQNAGEHMLVARADEDGAALVPAGLLQPPEQPREIAERERDVPGGDRILQAHDAGAQLRVLAAGDDVEQVLAHGRDVQSGAEFQGVHLLSPSPARACGSPPRRGSRGRRQRVDGQPALLSQMHEMGDVRIVASRISRRSGTRRSNARVASATPGLMRLRSARPSSSIS
jgi:hypothetical protein